MRIVSAGASPVCRRPPIRERAGVWGARLAEGDRGAALAWWPRWRSARLALDDGERMPPPESEAPPEARSATTGAVGKERSDWCRRELRSDARRAFAMWLFGVLGWTVVDEDLGDFVARVVWCGHGMPLVRLTAPARSDRGRLRAKRLTVHAPRDARRLDSVQANSATGA